MIRNTWMQLTQLTKTAWGSSLFRPLPKFLPTLCTLTEKAIFQCFLRLNETRTVYHVDPCCKVCAIECGHWKLRSQLQWANRKFNLNVWSHKTWIKYDQILTICILMGKRETNDAEVSGKESKNHGVISLTFFVPLHYLGFPKHVF